MLVWNAIVLLGVISRLQKQKFSEYKIKLHLLKHWRCVKIYIRSYFKFICEFINWAGKCIWYFNLLVLAQDYPYGEGDVVIDKRNLKDEEEYLQQDDPAKTQVETSSAWLSYIKQINYEDTTR